MNEPTANESTAAQPAAGEPADDRSAGQPAVASRTADVTAGPGGVMTDEVGVITGDLTLRSELDAARRLTLRVQYRDAAEWYTVTGGVTELADPVDLAAVHEIAVALLDRPLG